jgi:hypothetical protein
MTLQLYPILTTFRTIDHEADLQRIFEARQEIFLDRIHYLCSPAIDDLLAGGHDIPVLMVQTMDKDELIAHAKENMMVNIGTRICLLSETIQDSWWGTVHHTIGLVRCPKPILWQIVDVCWAEQDPCPLSM